MRRLVALSLLLVVPACDPVEDLRPEDVCDDARRAIGLRTEACTGDSELADQRFAAASTLTCKAREVSASRYDCSQTILDYPCEAVAELGDDLRRWVAVRACDPLFAGTAAGSCVHAPDGTCSCVKVKEAPSCDLPPASDTATPYCCREGNFPTDGACACRYVKCAEQGSTCVCSASQAPSGTPTLLCAKHAKPDYEECCAGNGLCTCRKGQGCSSSERAVPACTPQALCVGQVVSTCSL